MATLLVTGGAGFIGSHIAVEMVRRGHNVRILDDFSTGRRENLSDVADDIEIITGSMRDADTCVAACTGVEFVFHEAAIPSVPKSIDKPWDSHRANVDGTFNLLMAARENGVRRFVYAASSSAYGDTDVSPKHEGLRSTPLSPYAAQKLMGEHYCSAFFHSWGLETLSIRYFNVFGPRQDPRSTYAAAIPAFVSAILKGEQPIVYGDGEQTRDFTYIDNVVAGNVLAMEAGKTCAESVNVACGGQISINRVIRAINDVLGTDVEPKYVPRRAGDVLHSCADIGLAREVLGYNPVVDFEEGLSRTIEYYKAIS